MSRIQAGGNRFPSEPTSGAAALNHYGKERESADRTNFHHEGKVWNKDKLEEKSCSGNKTPVYLVKEVFTLLENLCVITVCKEILNVKQNLKNILVA